MNNLLARGGIEFLAVLLGITGSLWVDDYRTSLLNQEKAVNTLKNLREELIDDREYSAWRTTSLMRDNEILHSVINNWGKTKADSLVSLEFEGRNLMLRLTGYYAFHPPRTVYNSLRSDGSLALIPDNELKEKINHTFHEMPAHITEGAENNQYLYRRFKDYLVENHPALLSPTLQGFEAETERFLADQVVLAYLFEQQGIRAFLLRIIDRHIKDLDELIETIDTYLMEA